MDQEIGNRIQVLRNRSGLSLRQLADRAKVTPAMISCIERGKNSPSVATLQKILHALGTDLATFFANGNDRHEGPFFFRENMQSVSDKERTYTIILPHREEHRVSMLDEYIYPGTELPEYEELQCDVAGYILAGKMELDIEGRDRQTLRPGDSFYIPMGTVHRGWALGDEPARLITVYDPPNY